MRKKEFFQTKYLSIKPSLHLVLNIQLEEEEIQLKEAVVQSISKEDRAFYLKEFKRLFLGRPKAAKFCKIKNEEDLRFFYDQKDKILKVTSRSPLQIENQFLGYQIEYDLLEFEVNYKINYVLVLGSSFFKEMKASATKLNKWEKNRAASYDGSIEHFIKSLYQNKIIENGFDIKRLIRIENPAYLKFKEEIANTFNPKIEVGKIPPKIISYLINQPVPNDSLVLVDGTRKFLYFEGLYRIEYTQEKEDLE